MVRRISFYLVSLLAAGLAIFVYLAPLLDRADPELSSDLLALFARDITVRQTAIGCAIGLLITAMLFLRPREGEEENRKAKAKKRSRMNSAVGA